MKTVAILAFISLVVICAVEHAEVSDLNRRNAWQAQKILSLWERIRFLEALTNESQP